MAKQHDNNALIVLLCLLLGLALPLSAWLLLRVMTVEAVISIKSDKLDEKIHQLERLLEATKKD